MDTIDQPTKKLERVLAASFTWCCEDYCQFGKKEHLLVTTSYVLLETGNAIAISYTWGEFDRRDVSIGHDKTGRGITVNLGCEWRESDFIDRITSIGWELTSAETPIPFWIDQLCIPQDNEDIIRDTINSIPLIFYTFDSIALLPGFPCKCLRESLEEYGRHTILNNTQAELDQLSMEWSERMGLCVNSISFCSYFERVWTRQEMLYTRKLRVYWTGFEESPCVRPSAGNKNIVFGLLSIDDDETDINQVEATAMEAEQNLAPFGRQIFQRALSADITYAHALTRVKIKHDKAWHNAVLAFEDFRSKTTPRAHGRYYAIDLLCRFLSCEPLEFIHDEPHDTVMSDERRLTKFISRLSGVGWVQRSATKPRDYVLAVWISCPKYVIPKDYTNMSLPQLLEDAISQLERNFKLTVPVTAFAGLFGGLRPSGFWKPHQYLVEREVLHTQHVYGPVISECPLISVTEAQSLPLNVYSAGIGRSKNMMTFAEAVDGKSATEILRFVDHIIMGWSNATMERIESARPLEFIEPVDGFHAGLKANMLLRHPTKRQTMAPELALLQGMETTLTHATLCMISESFDQFYAILFDLVCDALGLSLKSVTLTTSLTLIVYSSEYPTIGICRKDKATFVPTLAGDESLQNRVTVCRDVIGFGAGHTILELSKCGCEDNKLPQFEAIGVWVPQQLTPWEHVAGVVTKETLQNALLV